METSSETDKLFEALVKARAEMGNVPKTGKNKYQGYTYSELKDYIQVLKAPLEKHGLMVISESAGMNPAEERKTKNGGTEYLTRVHVNMMIVHTSGQWIKTTSLGEGQDFADKGLYASITGARKYGLAGLFNLATDEDPEKNEEVGQTSAPKRGGKGKSKPPATKKQEPDDETPYGKATSALRESADPKGLANVVTRIEQRHKEEVFTTTQFTTLLQVALDKLAGMEKVFPDEVKELAQIINDKLMPLQEMNERFSSGKREQVTV